MFIALASLLTDRPVRSDVAMTGEISLRGLVLPIGGVKEKVLAAQRAGITTVLLPARNRRDLEDIPESARDSSSSSGSSRSTTRSRRRSAKPRPMPSRSPFRLNELTPASRPSRHRAGARRFARAYVAACGSPDLRSRMIDIFVVFYDIVWVHGRKDGHGALARTLIQRLVRDERSAVAFRHAAVASIVALAITGLGIILVILGNQVYEQSSGHVLWALVGTSAVLGA